MASPRSTRSDIGPQVTAVYRDTTSSQGEIIVLRWAIIFFVIALVAAVFGFGGIAGASADIAQILFFGFLIFAVIALIMNVVGKRSL